MAHHGDVGPACPARGARQRVGWGMRIDVYQGSVLAASFDYRDDLHMATFYGAAGQAVRAGIPAPPAGVAWPPAACLAVRLARAGFRVVTHGAPNGSADQPLSA